MFTAATEDALKIGKILFSEKKYFLAIAELQKVSLKDPQREEALYLLDKVVVASLKDIPHGSRYMELRDKTMAELKKLNV